MIAGNWKLLVPTTQNEPTGAVELYDLAHDPAEEHNLAPQETARVRRLTHQLDHWWPGR